MVEQKETQRWPSREPGSCLDKARCMQGTLLGARTRYKARPHTDLISLRPGCLIPLNLGVDGLAGSAMTN